MFDDHINVAITAWATIALFLATAIGFGFVACQAAELKITIADEALNTLYNQYSEMLSLLCTKPHLYPYIYGDAELSERDIQEHPTLRAEINLICETILALIEHSLMFNRKLSRDAWNNC